MVFSLYLLFAGHNEPGGGFAGGLVAGLALVLRYLAGGRYELGEAAPVDPGCCSAPGCSSPAAPAWPGCCSVAEVLQTAILEATLPVLGDVKLVTSLFFDIGVYLVVVGLVLDVLRSLGAELDRQEDEDDPIEAAPGRGDRPMTPDRRPARDHRRALRLRHLPAARPQPHPGAARPPAAGQRHEPAAALHRRAGRAARRSSAYAGRRR